MNDSKNCQTKIRESNLLFIVYNMITIYSKLLLFPNDTQNCFIPFGWNTIFIKHEPSVLYSFNVNYVDFFIC